MEQNPDAIFRKYVGSMFKCTVIRYCAKKAKRSGGKVVDNGGDLEVNIKWDDAPAGFKVRGKSICGEEQRLTMHRGIQLNLRSCEKRETCNCNW